MVTSDGISAPSLMDIFRGATFATAVFRKTSTPIFSRSRFVRADNFGENVGSSRGPASIKLILMCFAACSWSFISGPETSSESAPAISTPVGPPPTTVSERTVSSSKRQRSSKRRIISARIFIASATLFIPNACSLTPSILKSAVADPRAKIK